MLTAKTTIILGRDDEGNPIKAKPGESFDPAEHGISETEADTLVARKMATRAGASVSASGAKSTGGEEGKGGDGADAIEEIVDAIALLEDGNTAHWGRDGKPDLKALESILGRKVKAADRDKAWERASK